MRCAGMGDVLHRAWDAMRWYAVVVTGHCGGDGGDDVVRPFLLRKIWARLSRLVWNWDG